MDLFWQAVGIPSIETCARSLEAIDNRLRQNNKHFIGFYRPDGPDTGVLKPLRQAVGHIVSVSREAQPQIVGEIGFQLRRHVSMLGNKVAATFAPVLHTSPACGIKKHNRFGRKGTPFRGAEGQNIDAGLPRLLAERLAIGR